MNLLAIETTGATPSVALINQEKHLLKMLSDEAKMAHLQSLMPMIEKLLLESEIKLSSIDAIAVSQGPGSFTGIRIGVSTARALTQAMNVPIVSVPTLKAMAYNLPNYEGLLCPIFDARRSQVYGGCYEWRDGECVKLLNDDAYDLQDFLTALETVLQNDTQKKEILFLGDGVAVYKEKIMQSLGNRAIFGDKEVLLQKASSVAALGAELFSLGKGSSYEQAKPEYLRKPEAQRKLEEQQNKVIVRPMEEKDLDDIIILEGLCFATPWPRESFEYELNSPVPNLYLVAEAKGRVVGYAGVWHVVGEGHITNVAVHPQFRNKKIGAMIVGELINVSVKKGIDAFTLEVRVNNEHAIALYKSYGFEESGLRKNYYADNKEDALIMWKRLANQGEE